MTPLPEEIFGLILSFLQPEIDHELDSWYDVQASHLDWVKRRTLAAICRVSHKCYRLASPLLYREVRILSGEREESQALLRTLLSRPDIAAETRELRIGEWKDANTNEPASLGQMQDALGSALKAVRNLGLSPGLENDLVDALRAGVEDAVIVVLLGSCTGIERLDMSAQYHMSGLEGTDIPADHPTLVWRFFEEIAGRNERCNSALEEAPAVIRPMTDVQRPLSRVRHVVLLSLHPDRIGGADALDAILRLPSIETLQARGVEAFGGVFPEDLTNRSDVASTLKKATFESSIFDAGGIADLLQACPQLESLSIEWHNYEHYVEEFSFDDIAEALSRYGTGLQYLTLAAPDCDMVDLNDDEEDANVYEWRPCGSLKALLQLRDLSISERALLGENDTNEPLRPTRLVDILPESLTDLEITSPLSQNENGLDEQLVVLVADKRFKNLKSIQVNRKLCFQGAYPDSDSGWQVEESWNYYVLLNRGKSPAL